MTRVKAIEEEVEKLSPDELSELRDWILERDWERWDRQIERDAAEGRLEPLFERALEAQRQGKSREV
jgi:hypothetical protein